MPVDEEQLCRYAAMKRYFSCKAESMTSVGVFSDPNLKGVRENSMQRLSTAICTRSYRRAEP